MPASVPSGGESTHRPTIAVVHASVGSGHRAAANAIAQTIERLRGLDGVPQDVQVDVLDILDFGKSSSTAIRLLLRSLEQQGRSMMSPGASHLPGAYCGVAAQHGRP